MRRKGLRRMILAAIFCALVVVMNLVPNTGYISVNVVEITTLHIVTIIAAVLLGSVYGLVVGGVWGVSCLIRAYIMTPMLAFGFGNPLVSVLPRLLVGLFAGLAFAGLKKTHLSVTLSLIISAIVGTLTNTVLVISGMMIFVKASASDTLRTIVTTIISLNGSLELAAAIIIVPAVYYALQPRDRVLGIDIGASATKLALTRGKTIIRTMLKHDDESLDEVLTRFNIEGVDRVAVTGVGASYVEGKIAGLPTIKVDEFVSLSRGVMALAKSYNCLVASIGTGTSFVRVTPFGSWHVGGTGVGGAMLLSLGKRLCKVDTLNELSELAHEGDNSKVDIQLRDVSQGEISNLRPETTVANLAKLDGVSDSKDVAKGLYTLVFESIGVMAACAVKTHLSRKVVVAGTIAQQQTLTQDILDSVGRLHGVRFVVPENAGFIAAVGASKIR
ncbi:MAG TPA: ECF transporter S component [Eubacteriales bacterium]|nr:ECF transporter S component [Clostridia bacterium]HRV73611.1 ECF transporter S component [Eubacteriales bacterium]